MIDVKNCKRSKDGYIYGSSDSGAFRIDKSGKSFMIKFNNNTCIGTEINFDYDVPANTYDSSSAKITTKSEFMKVYREFKQKLKSLKL